MPNFSQGTYANMVAQQTEVQKRLMAQYSGTNSHFDVIIVGSGMGGGILADDLADRFEALGINKQILVLEAGSYLFPTHVFNSNRFPNDGVAKKYAVKTFTQNTTANDKYYIGERPQLNFGGRSIFWSGLIPSLQPWELEFLPQNVRDGVSSRLGEAGRKLNASITLGKKAAAVVQALRQSPLAQHFDIRETPRALHQPYLTAEGTPGDEFWVESTGVFNTAELLTNQVGLNPDDSTTANGRKLQILLNHYVETVEQRPAGDYVLKVQDVLGNVSRTFTAAIVVLAAGSIESPKVIRRSPIFNALPSASQNQVGRGLTDHPTTDWARGLVTNIGGTSLPKNSHAKIVFYSKGLRDANGSIMYPFNIEMNLNHEYWHLREDDPSNPQQPIGRGHESLLEIKFSFGNLLDDDNQIQFGADLYVPEIRFKNLGWVDDLANNRFKALAGWNKSYDDIWWVLNDLTNQIYSQFERDGQRAQPEGWYGQNGQDFGYGTVHHAVGTLRMPYKSRFDTAQFNTDSVVDENLMVLGNPNFYVCDMSVLPYSSTANPVRTLAALALRLSQQLTTL